MSNSRGSTLPRLVDIMDALLAPDGCPWDREQTLDSLRPYLIEEACEVLDAIDKDNPEEHCDELGDLLLQIVFQAAIRQRQSKFDIDDIVAAISEKLVRRHPHVFGDATAEDADEVVTNWEAIKAQEKAGKPRTSVLADVPRALPALMRAQKLSKRAAKVGFDWPDVEGSLAKVREELKEVETALQAGDTQAAQAELGDLLFATVNLARKLNCDAETALRDTTKKFVYRFQHVEEQLAKKGTCPEDSTLDEMDSLWEQAKGIKDFA